VHRTAHYRTLPVAPLIPPGLRGVPIAGHTIRANPGTTVHVPKGIAHGIVNTGDEPLSFLEATSPPGFQEIFRKLSRLSEPNPEDIARLGAEYDIIVRPGETP